MLTVPTPVMAGLRASAPSPLPFGDAIEIRAFLLEREAGDVVVYSAPAAKDQLGGAGLQLLGHWHEAAVGGEPVGVPVRAHEGDVPEIPAPWRIAEPLRERTRLGDDLEAIPIPGHTPGSTAYLWDSGRRRFLFTADSVYLDGDEWVAAVLGSSDRAAYVDSLDLLREIEFDVLVPWVATAGHAPVAHTDRDDARRRLGAIIDRLWRGEDR